jgi:dihydrofolate reductase
LRVSLIVAVAENGVIGRDGDLPWRLSSDLRYFKSVTMGKPIIMGRKTFQSIGRPLPGRPNFVVSRNPEFNADGITVFSSLGAAIGQARESGCKEVMIIGGAGIYEEGLSVADRIYLTQVHADVPGDVTFPVLDPTKWTGTSRERKAAGKNDDHEHSFVVLDRIRTG